MGVVNGKDSYFQNRSRVFSSGFSVTFNNAIDGAENFNTELS